MFRWHLMDLKWIIHYHEINLKLKWTLLLLKQGDKLHSTKLWKSWKYVEFFHECFSASENKFCVNRSLKRMAASCGTERDGQLALECSEAKTHHTGAWAGRQSMERVLKGTVSCCCVFTQMNAGNGVNLADSFCWLQCASVLNETKHMCVSSTLIWYQHVF